MKGISHFITGVALATFFPEVVQQAALGGLLPMLGGIGGILPDTIDFKFARYWEKFDVEIDPGPAPDAAAIADALVDAMRAAYATRRDQNVIAHTLRLGADLWREYVIRFDPEAGEVAVKIGPLVNTGQVPYAGTEPEGAAEVRRFVGVPLVHTYSDEYKVNIFSGPTFRFARAGDKLVVHFLDWHHRWTHSLLLAVGVGLLMGLLIGLLTGDWHLGRWGGLVTWLGFSGHILEDQLGHMGSNLFWPLTHHRIPGPGLIHAGDAIPNFLTVWTSLALILFNLDRFSATPHLPPGPYLLGAVSVPWLLLGGAYIAGKLRQKRAQPSPESQRQSEQIAEAKLLELT
ncbi:MAG TPA: metal-dependent hydrolase [Anaerolineae bacterium]|nr:metal-dependent hydrolase [Anaerolineae bacterium]